MAESPVILIENTLRLVKHYFKIKIMVQVEGIEPSMLSRRVTVLQTAAVAAEPHLHIGGR